MPQPSVAVKSSAGRSLGYAPVHDHRSGSSRHRESRPRGRAVWAGAVGGLAPAHSLLGRVARDANGGRVVNRFDYVSLLTDYGLRDEFVGVVKCVIADVAPHVTVLDITHDVAPFDVRAGSLALARAVPYVPKGVVMAVVDPGVGSSRRAIAVSVAEGTGVFIGPDNGLLAPAVALAGGAEHAVELTNRRYHLDAPGATFAGRDVFAPVAAHVCAGVPLSEMGPEIDPASILPGVVPLPREVDGALQCEVTWVDRFGNCQLNVSADEVAALGTVVRIVIGAEDPAHAVERSAPMVSTYAAIGGGLGLVVDSYGMVSIAVDRSSAAVETGLTPGSLVVLSSGSVPATPVQITRAPRA